MLYASAWSRFELTTSVVICSDCIGSCKSNYHKITATTFARFCLGRLYVPSWMFCFGVGFFIFQVECFVLELPSLCSKLNVLFWSCRLYIPSWMFCFGVAVFMFLVDCFVLELASLYSKLNVLFWSCRLYVPSWMFCFGVAVFIFQVECFVYWVSVFMFLVECFVLELASICSYLNVLI
jgi:hypothetical protein